MKKINNIFLEKIDSTNKYVKDNLLSFDPEIITCITTDYQTEGKGRYDHKWISSKGKNILTSFYFRLFFFPKNVGSLSLIACLSICKILENENLKPKIKWPNDIQLNEKKLAGILCEAQFSKTYVDIILGAGININSNKEELSIIDKPATSLFIETKKIWEREEILKNLQKEFAKNLDIFEKEGFSYFLSDFKKLLAYQNKTLHFYDGENIFKGHIDSLTKEGSLKFYIATTKEIKTFHSGEIISAK